MIQTAENVARSTVSTAQQDELTAAPLRAYRDALADDAAFLRRFMDLPFAVPDSRFKRTPARSTATRASMRRPPKASQA